MKLRYRHLNYLLIICLFGFGIFYIFNNVTINTNNSNQFNIYLPVSPKSKIQAPVYSIHAPITISGDGEFHTQAQLNGWAGNGTDSEPYIIQNYNITSTNTNGSAITIGFTTVFFVIYNCYFFNNGNSNTISLNTVRNGLIMANNITTDCNLSIKIGVYVINSSNTNITSNTIINYVYGIGITLSSSISLSNNLLTNNLDGISVTYSKNSLIANNQIFLSKAIGVNVYNVNASTFTNNTVKYANIGFYLFNTRATLIEKSIIDLNNYGINLYSSINNSIISNLLRNNNIYGVQLFNSNANRIFYNYFIFNNGFASSQAYCDTNANAWTDGKFGNYWSNYNDTNSNNTNIGTTPYAIAGGAYVYDLHPLLHAITGDILSSNSILSYQVGSKAILLNWIVVSLQPANYSIYKDGIQMISGSEEFGIPVQYNPGSLSTGTYNYTIVLTVSGHKQTNNILVNVYSCNLLACNGVILPFINNQFYFLGFLFVFLISLIVLVRRYWLDILGILLGILNVLYVPSHKLDKIEAMVHTKRRKIIDLLTIQAEKGETLQNLIGKMNISKQLLLWHLKILEDFSIVETFKIKRELVIVLQEYSDRFDPILKEFELSFTSHQGQEFRNFLLNLNKDQTFSIQDVIIRTNWNKRTAQRHLKYLQNLQILSKDENSNLYKINIKNSLIMKSIGNLK